MADIQMYRFNGSAWVEVNPVPAAHTHDYNSLTNKPTIPTVPSYATKAQAEAGTATTGIMSPLRVKQAIDKFAAPIGDYALRSELPTIPSITVSNGAAETGKYIKSISASGHTITVVKDTLPSGGGGGAPTRTFLATRASAGQMSLGQTIHNFDEILVEANTSIGDMTSSTNPYMTMGTSHTCRTAKFEYSEKDPLFGIGHEIRGGCIFPVLLSPSSTEVGRVMLYQSDKNGSKLTLNISGSFSDLNVAVFGIKY